MINFLKIIEKFFYRYYKFITKNILTLKIIKILLNKLFIIFMIYN